MSGLIPANQKVNLGLTAIIQTLDGSESYWALTHPDAQADFHIRDGFTIQ